MSYEYQKIVAYSIANDCDVVRLSMCDDEGAEFWGELLDNGTSKDLRVKINGFDAEVDGELTHHPGALDYLMQALASGTQPGKVEIPE